MKRAVCCLMLCAALLLTSCGLGEEIDTLGIVVGAAFDKPESEGNINMTVCILKASGKSGSESEGGGEKKGGGSYTIASSEASSFFEAQSNLMLSMERKPFWGHDSILFIAQDISMKPVIEAFTNGYEKRGSELIVMMKGKAADALSSTNFMGDVSAVSITEILGQTSKNGYLTEVTVHDLFSKMTSRSQATIVPYGTTDEDGNFTFLGLCAVRDYAFSCALTDEEAVGATIASNLYHSGGISVPMENAYAGIYLLDARCNIECTEDMQFTLRARTDYSLEDVNGEANLGNDEIRNVIDEYIKKLIEEAIRKSQESGTDFIGFSDIYFKKYATEMPGDLTDARFTVAVEGNLKYKGIED